MRRSIRTVIADPALALAAILVVLLGTVGTVGPGCILVEEGTIAIESDAEQVGAVYHCTADLSPSPGDFESVSSTDARFSSVTLAAHQDCAPPPQTLADIEAYWRQLLRSEYETGCMISAHCWEETPIYEATTCPPALSGEPLVDCPPTDRCLTFDPPPDPAEPDFESSVDFGTADVGAGGGESTVRVTNSCGAEARVRATGTTEGEWNDFSIFDNGCDPEGTETDWHVLAPGESCSMIFSFWPKAHGDRLAATPLLRASDPLERYQIALRGFGQGGELEVEPQSLCFDELLDGLQDECNNGTGTARRAVVFTHGNGPAVEIQEPHMIGGAFWVDESLTEFTVAPGPPARVQVLWCAYGGDIDDEGTLFFETNGVDPSITIELERTTGRCP